MSDIIVLSHGGCRLVAEPSGEVALTDGRNALTLCPAERDVETVVGKRDDAIYVRSRRDGFRLDRVLSRPVGSEPFLARVACTCTAERAAPLFGLMDHWSASIEPPHDFRWAPNLRPVKEMRVGSHCFRSPVVVVSGGSGWAAVIPDFRSDMARESAHLCALDLDGATSDEMRLGFGIEPTRPTGHVLFEIDPSVLVEEGDTFGFEYYLLLSSTVGRREALRGVSTFLWQGYAKPHVAGKLPQTVPFDRYADYAYPSLLTTPPFVRFEIGGKLAGGVSAEPAHADYFERPHPVVWNQYWFNNQRAAYGFGLNGKIRGDSSLLEAGRRMTATTLAAPEWGGLWPAMYAYEDREWWGSIPRLNGGRRRIHVADAAMTGEWLLHWELDVESTSGGLERIRSMANCLCRLQKADGSIPPWHDWNGTELRPDTVLERSAETGAATAFLGQLIQVIDSKEITTAIIHGAEFLSAEVMQHQRYQDFETFFSCSPKGLDMFDSITGIYPQNSLAVFWTARTMLSAYRITGDDGWKRLAIEATDILSLYQQVWNPPFLSIHAFGGFGVMNTDAEWNDARQSLFAPHYFDMYEATGLIEYLERGRVALRASFVLASIPENSDVSPQTYDAYPPGLMPENYGHSGRDAPSGRSDTCWGESGALSSVAWIRKRYPELIDDLESS